MWPFRLWKFVKSAGRDGVVLAFALRDPRTPTLLKAGIVALALYAISPIDLVPDIALLFGWADDLALLLLGVPFLANRLPETVRADAASRADRLLGRWFVRRA